MSYSIETIKAREIDLEEVLDFLVNSPGECHSRDDWSKRINSWWFSNPEMDFSEVNGWMMRFDGKLVGVLAAVPQKYGLDGRIIPALAATTWRVMEEHRNQSLRLWFPFYKMSQSTLLLNTTPNEAVIKIVQKSGFRSCSKATRHLFLTKSFIGGAEKWVGAKKWPIEKKNGQPNFFYLIADVKGIAKHTMQSRRLEKWISLEYLSWVVNHSKAAPRFIGTTNEAGVLTSYLLVTEANVKKFPSLRVVDWFTTEDNRESTYSLLRHLCSNYQKILGFRKAFFVEIISISDGFFWDQAPFILKRELRVNHYFALPTDLAQAEKRCALVEGDYLL